MPIACLPWYDLPETQKITDRLWFEIAKSLRAEGMVQVPERLDRRADYQSQWQEPGLLLGQACGYDVYCENDHALQIVGAPRYRLRGCEGPRYRSFVVVHKNSTYKSLMDLKDARCVINSPRSHSGMNVLQSLIAPLSDNGHFFGGVQISGAHQNSLKMIASRAADVAAIDCITFGLLAKHRPDSISATRIIHETDALTAPPYVTGSNTDARLVPVLRRAIQGAIATLTERDRDDLGLEGVEAARMEDYHDIGAIQALADQHCYVELRPNAIGGG